MKRTSLASIMAGVALAALAGSFALAQSNQRNGGAEAPTATEPQEHDPVGYTDTPVIPGQKWRVHDIDRPRPRHVTPGAQYGQPPSGAVGLFVGKALSKGEKRGERGEARENVTPSRRGEE